MRLPPKLDPARLFRSPEVIAIGLAAQPAALTGLFAGRPAGGFGTIPLVMAVAVVSQENILATKTLATACVESHNGSLWKKIRPKQRQENQPGKNTKREEGRTNLNEHLEENGHGRKRSFKPPAFLRFSTAAHTDAKNEPIKLEIIHINDNPVLFLLSYFFLSITTPLEPKLEIELPQQLPEGTRFYRV
jgi:hypothetical protein